MAVRQDDDRRSWRVLQAALVLILCRDEHRLPPKLHRRMLRWMQRSPENLIHLFEIARVDRELGRLKLSNRSAQIAASISPPPRMALLPRRAVWLGGAAVVAMSLFVGLSVSMRTDDGPTIRHMTLDDGSVMHVLRGTDFDVEFSDDVRLIELSHGEAVFDVAKDSQRPLIVRSRISDSIAVGTRFGVVTDSTQTVTTVSHGQVRVVPAGTDSATGTMLQAGEALRVAAGSARSEPVAIVNANRSLSWSAGWLEFDGETVGDAVRTFNRFSDVQIQITQPELSSARLKYYRFELDKPESFAIYVGKALGAPVLRNSTAKVIYIGEGQRDPE